MSPDRVLVVDDTPETLALLTDALEEAGMTVLVATNGEAALACAVEGSPDIILLDAVMPGLDGFETCVRLKQLPASAGVPVVFMTGLTETEHVVHGFQAGGIDYVTKPISPDQLIARIRAHLTTARLVSNAHDALDLSGRTVFSVDASGRITWKTPAAGRILQEMAVTGATGMPLPMLEKLLAALPTEDFGSRAPAGVEVQSRDRRVVLTPIRKTGAGELLVRIEARSLIDAAQLLQTPLYLTAREREVLVWIARGKSNRAIGEILALSPRTVNKHLERIYVKLGVENRASAAAVAIAALQARE